MRLPCAEAQCRLCGRLGASLCGCAARKVVRAPRALHMEKASKKPPDGLPPGGFWFLQFQEFRCKTAALWEGWRLSIAYTPPNRKTEDALPPIRHNRSFPQKGSRCNPHAWKADFGGILCARGLCPRQGNRPFQLVVRFAEARTPFAARRANAKRGRGRWRKFRACRLFAARGIAAFSLRPAAGRQAVRRMLVLSAMLPGALSPARCCPLRRAPPAACPARTRAPRPAQPGLRP